MKEGFPKYTGRYKEDGNAEVLIEVWPGHTVELTPGISRYIYKHSLEFSWGYGGSGPAQLALALLVDATHSSLIAQRNHQQFKDAYVATWPQDGAWEISRSEIRRWLEESQHESMSIKKVEE